MKGWIELVDLFTEGEIAINVSIIHSFSNSVLYLMENGLVKKFKVKETYEEIKQKIIEAS